MRHSVLLALGLLVAACAGDRPPASGGPDAHAPEPTPDPVQKDTVQPKRESAGFRVDGKSRFIDGGYARHLKLLYLEQSFRHEARWLNECLKRDRGLDYQAFFLDADLEWTQPTSIYDDAARARVESLRAPFWKGGKLVSEDNEFNSLGYDVVVLGDINCSDAFWHDTYWGWIESWVKAGCGLIFIGGMRYTPAAYNNECAQHLLPVTVDTAEPVETTRVKYFGATAEGMKHSLFELADTRNRVAELLGEEGESGFKRGQLGGIYWYLPGVRARSNATVLARAVSEGQKISDGAPLVVSATYGKGRVLFVGTDDTHRWREIVGDAYFYRFWRNAFAWVDKAE